MRIKEGAKRKVFARDPIFGGSCVPKPLPLKDSNFIEVSQAARKIKRAEIGGQQRARSIKLPKLGCIVQKLEKIG